MSAEDLVKVLEELEIIENGDINAVDIEWMFMGSEADSFNELLSWLVNNSNSANVLSKEEFNRYKELESNNKVLHGSHLDAMSSCLSTIDPLSTINILGTDPKDDEKHQADLAEELDCLEKSLQKLNRQRDQLSFESISVAGEISRLDRMAQTEQDELGKYQKDAMKAAVDFKMALDNLSFAADKLTDVLNSIPMKDSRFLVSVEMTEWKEEEDKCTAAMEQLLKKQFPESIDLNEESSDGDEVLELVHGGGPETNESQMKELTRLGSAIQKEELECIEQEVRAARMKAEVEETAKVLEKIKRGAAASYVSNSSKEVAALTALREEVARQTILVQSLAATASKRHVTEVLVHMLEGKCRRNAYYCEKLHQMISDVVLQLSRQDVLSVAVQCEAARLGEALETLLQARSAVFLHCNQASHTLEYLQGLHQDIEEEKMLGLLPASLSTLGAIFCEEEEPAPNLNVPKVVNQTVSLTTSQSTRVASQLERLRKDLDSQEQQLAALSQPCVQRLNTLLGKTSLLEDCISGGAGLPPTLPQEWLPDDLIDERQRLEDEAFRLRPDMVALLNQYEDKKKVLTAQPEMKDKLEAWANCD